MAGHPDDLPVYLVARGDRWLTVPDGPERALLAYGNEAEARDAVAREAERLSAPPCTFRLAEFAPTGRVLEG